MSDLQLRSRTLSLARPAVMGVINVTPDSFSDGGQHLSAGAAIDEAARMIADGAALLDIGGESSRPGAQPVSEQAELDRVIPVIEALTQRFPVPISIDTVKPGVMRAACAAGAELINDINALQAEDALQVARDTGAAVCLMHMQGQPQSMQAAPAYTVPVVDAVLAFLQDRAAAAEQAGIMRARIVLDPGIGFGKTLTHNLALLAAIPQLAALGYPLLIGVSRKSMFGQLLGLPVDQRDPASMVAAALAVADGARLIRTHNVALTVQALALVAAWRDAR
jgi:dihydropteroate synthase